MAVSQPSGAKGEGEFPAPWLQSVRHTRGRFILEVEQWRTAQGLTVVVGLNGAGKSTLLDLLAQRQRPTEGEAGGARYTLLPQNASLSVGRSVRDVYVYLSGLRRVSREQRRGEVDRVLAVAGLENRADQRVDELSGGWRQRVIIGQCLFGQPRGLLLDEPTSSLDVGAARECWHLLKKLSADVPTVVATHEASAALEFADRLVMIQNGHVNTPVEGDSLRLQMGQYQGSAESFLLDLITPAEGA